MLSASFTHEANGNTTADGRANLTFTYNLLNLPETVTSGNTQTATYHWLADGTKYKVTDPAGNGMIYAGDLTYTVTVSDGNTTYALESAEASVDGTARFLKNGTAMTPYYTIRDHLGSVRTIVNASGTVVERNDYYPFGSRTTFGASYATLASNRQKFSGKEDQSTIGSSTLQYLDFGARMYDSRLVRWSTYDPMAEKYYGINPYVYCNGDPVNLVDIEGGHPVVYALLKGLVGAVADAGAQITVSRAAGLSFGQAVSNIDYTSVGASFVTSALAIPGMSTTAKVVSASVIATDVLFDINMEGDIQSVGGIVGNKKPNAKVAIDVAANALPGGEKVINDFTSGFTKAIDADLGSKAAATLTKEAKTSLKQAREIANNKYLQLITKGVAIYSGGLMEGSSKEAVNTIIPNSYKNNSNPAYDPSCQPVDATRVNKVNLNRF